MHRRLSAVLYTRWVLKIHHLSTHWRLEQTHKNHFLHLTTHLPFLNYSAFIKEERQFATYSQNKCKYSSDNPLISNDFPSQCRIPVHSSLSPTTPLIFFLDRVSVLSFTLKAIYLPWDKGFPLSRWQQMLGLREKAIIPDTMTLPRILQQSALLGFFFFFWQRRHNSGIYAKIIKWRLLLKGPIHHSSPPILPLLGWQHVGSVTRADVCSKASALHLQLLCRLMGRGESSLATKNVSSGLEVAENILTYWQRHQRVRIVMLRMFTFSFRSYWALNLKLFSQKKETWMIKQHMSRDAVIF